MTTCRKKPLRTSGPIRKYPLAGGAEAPNGTPDGAAETETDGRRRGGKIETVEAGRAVQVRAHLGLYCLWLFDIAGI